MAVLRYKVTEILKKYNGDTCEVRGKIISVHKEFLRKFEEFTSELDLKIGEEFQIGNKTKLKQKL